MKKELNKFYVSLFSGGGIGDIGFRKAGLTPLLLNEIDPMRAELASINFGKENVLNADILQSIDRIEYVVKERLLKLNVSKLFLISATPPCQGMSKNGIGSILKAIREGKRPKNDERNRLFLPALELTKRLKPDFFFFENVDRMANFFFVDEKGVSQPVTEYISKCLYSIGYVGGFKKINMAEYGIPQKRMRLVGVFCLSSISDEVVEKTDLLFPKPTHTPEKFITLRNAIGDLPSLDSKNKKNATSDFHFLHHVPVSRGELYYWISKTKEGRSAFENNFCVKCGFENLKQDVFCKKCKSLLPKPVVSKNGDIRIIKGFVSAYKRMKFDEPAHTLTTRSAYACSDVNLHPAQNRVLSLFEVAILQGINPKDYVWGPIEVYNKRKETVEVKMPSDMLLRDVLGEPVPPVFTEKIGKHLLSVSRN